MTDEEKKIYVGNIVAPHGIKGEFKIRIDNQYVDYIINYFSKIKFYSIEESIIELRLRKKNEKFIIASIDGINDRTAAEAYKKTGIYCSVNDLPKLEDNEFYYSDLINKKIINEEGKEIGKVINVLNFGAGDIIEIKTADGRQEMYPFNKEVFPSIESDHVKFITQIL